MDDESFLSLINQITEGKIENLVLSNDFFLTSDQFVTLTEILKTNTSLKGLNILYHELTPETVKLLADAIETNQTLQHILFWNCHIEDTGAEYLAAALSKNTSVTSIGLPFNKISAEGVKYFAAKLKENKTWISLNFCSNLLIGDKGAEYLAENLAANATLETLTLSSTGITDHGAKYLALSLEKNHALLSLTLIDNLITDIGGQDFVDAIRNNLSLQLIDLRYNNDIRTTTLDDLKKLSARNHSTLALAMVLLQAAQQQGNLFTEFPHEVLEKICAFTITECEQDSKALNTFGFFNVVKNKIPRLENANIASHKQKLALLLG